MTLQYFYILILFVIIFIVFEDPNVPKYIELRYQLLRINIIRWFMIRKMRKQLDNDLKEIKKWAKENGKDQM